MNEYLHFPLLDSLIRTYEVTPDRLDNYGVDTIIRAMISTKTMTHCARKLFDYY